MEKVVCPKCQGRGKVLNPTYTPYGRLVYDCCFFCNQTGKASADKASQWLNLTSRMPKPFAPLVEPPVRTRAGRDY